MSVQGGTYITEKLQHAEQIAWLLIHRKEGDGRLINHISCICRKITKGAETKKW